MAFASQVWTLMKKNWRSLLFRHLAVCIGLAFVLPILLSGFFSYAKNLFVPPAVFGFGDPVAVRTLHEAFDHAKDSGRDKFILVDNGHSGGGIGRVLDRLSDQVESASSDMRVIRAKSEDELPGHCKSSLRGVTTCFCAVVMRSSPDQGKGGIWNYTIRTDSVMASSPVKINIDKTTNPPEIYLVPVQRAIDSLIHGLDHPNSNPLNETRELPFTDRTPHQRDLDIRRIYHRAITGFMGVVFITSVLWITYHLTGFLASERESGMSNLIDAMMPVRHQWMSQAARIISSHLSFSAIYAPAWIIASIVIRAGVFPNTSIGILLIFHILAGLSLASMSILFASFFKRAQLSGITAILACLLLGVLAQSITDPSTPIVAVLSLLFTPCNYVYFITLMARFEKKNRAASLTEMPPSSPWEIPGIAFWIVLVIHIVVYPLLGALVERGLYGTSTKGRRILAQGAEQSLGESAVELRGFTKIYPPGFFSRLFSLGAQPRGPVVAVKQLSLSARKGQIVALLGANGSGKSTTLDAIAGLNKLDDGSIAIDGTGGLGIAPQKNVLWDDLTVEEHLKVFNRLKAPKGQRATKEEIVDLMKAIDLLPKRKSQAKTLSGGQKRKLQLGMMLTGGSAVCCVDEVSSGLDPLSRRKIWDILLAERGRRTLILTTHFLDEADLLADHIAILSKGTLRAEGSSVELKDRLGGGYRVIVPKHPDLRKTPDIDGVRKKPSLDLITYIAPSSSLAAQVIKRLEDAGIADYRFSGPTIEDVFLQLAEEIRDEEAFRTTDRGAAYSREKMFDDEETSDAGAAPEGLKLMDGKRVGYIKQAMILFMKRFTVLKRNWFPYAVAFILPIAAAGLTSLYIKGQAPPGCSPADQASTSSTEDAFSQADDDENVFFLAGPRSGFSQSAVVDLFGPIFSGSFSGSSAGASALTNLKLVDTYDEFNQFIRGHRGNVTTGLWLGNEQAPPTFAWVANLFLTSSLAAQQFLDVVLTNTTIATTWSPFDIPFNPKTGDSLNLIVYMGLALSLFPAFFALYPSNERRRFVRGLQYSNGVRPLPLWIAYLLFDFMFSLVSAAIVTAVWAGISDIWYHIEYIFVVFFLYGLAATLLAYVVSLFTKTQLATYAFAAAIEVIGFLAYLIAYLSINTYVPAAKIGDSILIAHFVISAVAPVGSAIRALFLSLNLFSTACDDIHLSTNPGGILLYGGPILYLIVQCVILFGLLLWFDSGSAGSSIRGLFHGRGKEEDSGDVSDEEVANELTRVTSQGTHENGLRVMHLTKSFGKNTAVDNVTFGIKRGEVFALLGPNGAGKSTTISLIRGDIKPSRNGGDVFVEEASVTKSLADARSNLGVCPQIDAMDQMTVREHLEFYAKVRGIPDVEHNVTAVLRAVGLEAFAGRMAHALSGGNKRKLSLGIALMGNPGVVLLDEPSSGLDAASKRIMWKTLADTVPGRSILLTTHSMEEADALAGRAGIMARRMLALGTPDDLRHRFGDALHVHLVSTSAPRTTPEEMRRVIDHIQGAFPSAAVDDNTYHGQTRFSVRAADVLSAIKGPRANQTLGDDSDRTLNITTDSDLSQSAIGHFVVWIEERKAELGISHYSVSPTTLDQVFLAIVGKHNVQEENYDEKPRSRWRRMVSRK